jgi:hypothetical protein
LSWSISFCGLGVVARGLLMNNSGSDGKESFILGRGKSGSKRQAMVRFVSIFLWLTVGPHAVEVAVEGPVAAVEIRLDGQVVGIAKAPTWQAECDFGTVIRPHELVAVAFDEGGVELDRARQVLNLPRSDAEVEMILVSGSSAQPVAVRVVAQSAQHYEPVHVLVTFDGETLSGSDGLYLLPNFNPEQAHILSAEATFPRGVSARDDLTLGGSHRGLVTSELTAVAVKVAGRRRPRPADFDGLLRARGVELRVAAVERPGGRVYLVRDHNSWPTLHEAGVKMERMWPTQGGFRFDRAYDLTPDLHRYHLVVPNATVRGDLSIFQVAGPYPLQRYGLPQLASQLVNTAASLDGQALTVAVAVAGVRAARDSCPRVVVLVLSDDIVDHSRDRPQDVMDYLKSLHVPLVVWTTGENKQTIWGPADDVSSPKALMNSAERVMKSLLRQWIVWVEGRHLASDIELDDPTGRFRLAE